MSGRASEQGWYGPSSKAISIAAALVPIYILYIHSKILQYLNSKLGEKRERAAAAAAETKERKVKRKDREKELTGPGREGKRNKESEK